VHRDEDAKDDSDEDRKKRRVHKHAEARGGEQSLRQRTLDGEISNRACE